MKFQVFLFIGTMNTLHQRSLFEAEQHARITNEFRPSNSNSTIVSETLGQNRSQASSPFVWFLRISIGLGVLALGGYACIFPEILSRENLREQSAAFQRGSAAAAQWLIRMTRPTLLIAGGPSLAEDAIRELLPTQESAWWWHFAVPEITRTLLSDPRIESVEIMPCSYIRLGCFTVNISERQTEFVAEVGNQRWLLGADGTFVAPAPEFKTDPLKMPPPHRYVLVRGLDSDTTSPQIVKARFDHVRRALQVIEGESQLRPRSVEFTQSGELKLTFRNFGFVAIFELNEKNPDHLRHQAARLRALLKDLGTRTSQIASIDLAFDKTAVVRLIEGLGKKG